MGTAVFASMVPTHPRPKFGAFLVESLKCFGSVNVYKSTEFFELVVHNNYST